MTFEVVPAIDLRGGRCVRLFQGDYARETVFSDDPIRVALAWCEQGARRLHVVDLDGARDGEPRHLAVLAELASSVPASIQFGGGLRSLKYVEAAILAGASRIILGTAALEDHAFLLSCLERWPGQIVVALDARGGMIATRGWLKTSTIRAEEMASELRRMGVSRFLYTDIGRDGTLTGPNLEGLKAVVDAGGNVLASGGIRDLDDLRAVKEAGASGAIIGRALYEGRINLAEALALQKVDDRHAG